MLVAFYIVQVFVAVVKEVNEMSENKSVKLAFDCAGGDLKELARLLPRSRRCCSVWEFPLTACDA